MYNILYTCLAIMLIMVYIGGSKVERRDDGS